MFKVIYLEYENEDRLQTYHEINSYSLGTNLYFTEKNIKNTINFKLDSEIDQRFKFKSLTHVGNAYSIRMKVRLN
ncbi:Iron-regulated protein FrpC (fragment) [Pseudoalteromonas sp. 3J6]